MVGNNYDTPNGLFGLERDVFLRLVAEKHHTDDDSRQLFGMGLRPYKWKNHLLFNLRKIPKKNEKPLKNLIHYHQKIMVIILQTPSITRLMILLHLLPHLQQSSYNP
jgi:hypothetical protein